MLTAKDIMTKTVITVTPETDISSAAKLLLEHRINGVPVVDEKGTLKGILCQSDLIAQQKQFPIPSFFTFMDGIIPLMSMKQFEKEISKIAATRVQEAMTPNPVTVSLDDPIEKVAELMVDKKYHTLPVMDGSILAGVIGKEDIIKTLINQGTA